MYHRRVLTAGTTCILVDGVGRCRVIEKKPGRLQVIVYLGRSYVLDEGTRINDLPIYRLDGYPPAPIRWGN